MTGCIHGQCAWQLLEPKRSQHQGLSQQPPEVKLMPTSPLTEEQQFPRGQRRWGQKKSPPLLSSWAIKTWLCLWGPSPDPQICSLTVTASEPRPLWDNTHLFQCSITQPRHTNRSIGKRVSLGSRSALYSCVTHSCVARSCVFLTSPAGR